MASDSLPQPALRSDSNPTALVPEAKARNSRGCAHVIMCNIMYDNRSVFNVKTCVFDNTPL